MGEIDPTIRGIQMTDLSVIIIGCFLNNQHEENGQHPANTGSYNFIQINNVQTICERLKEKNEKITKIESAAILKQNRERIFGKKL